MLAADDIFRVGGIDDLGHVACACHFQGLQGGGGVGAGGAGCGRGGGVA